MSRKAYEQTFLWKKYLPTLVERSRQETGPAITSLPLPSQQIQQADMDVFLPILSSLGEEISNLSSLGEEISNLSFRKGVCLVHLFDMVNFLVESGCKNPNLKKFSELSKTYIPISFPINPLLSSRMLVALRISKLSRNLLQQFVLESIDSPNNLSNEKIGISLMILLGLGEDFQSDLSTSINFKIDDDSPWKSVFSLDSFIVREFVPRFITALSYSLGKRMKKSCLPIQCFVYLTEWLVNHIYSTSTSNFYTTRSSFKEWCYCYKNFEASDLDDKRTLKMICLTEKLHLRAFFTNQFEILLSDVEGTKKWCKNSGCKDEFEIMLFRLMVLYSVVRVNSLYEPDHSKPKSLLQDEQLRGYLPIELVEGHFGCKEQILSTLASALQAKGDQIVHIHSETETSCDLELESIIHVKLYARENMEDILDMMYPSNNLTLTRDFEIENWSNLLNLAQETEEPSKKIAIVKQIQSFVGVLSKFGSKDLFQSNNESNYLIMQLKYLCSLLEMMSEPVGGEKGLLDKLKGCVEYLESRKDQLEYAWTLATAVDEPSNSLRKKKNKKKKKETTVKEGMDDSQENMVLTRIAEAVKDADILTPVDTLESMRTILKSFKDLGVTGGPLLAKIEKLIPISREHQTVEESMRKINAEIGSTREACDEKQAKIDNLRKSLLADENKIDQMKVDASRLEDQRERLRLKFKDVTQ